MIIGTAGHIDHGKTLLVSKLTGTETDRLKEEKERGISIELGFAYVPVPESVTDATPDGDILGFVDVPGHEKFVHTMVAGATGIDFALVVVAADDGVMPQTREHIQVLDLLGIKEGVVALNKIDLVDDARRAEAEAEIEQVLKDTGLDGIDVYPISAATGDGVSDLRQRLLDEAASRPTGALGGTFRMAIDRCFTLQGAGTIVTGAVRSGTIRTGDRVNVLPSGNEVRVRSLHAQGRKSDVGRAGDRCALNLAGIETSALRRGDWLTVPDAQETTDRFDVKMKLLNTEERPVRTWFPVHFHVGTSRVPARIVILEGDRVEPGTSSVVQVVTERPLPLVFGDLFILRDTSAGRTIGGGHVIHPRASQRRRRSDESRAMRDALQSRDAADAFDALLSLERGIVDLDAFVADRGLSDIECDDVMDLVEPLVLTLDGTRFATRPEFVEALSEGVVEILGAFHAQHPDLPGMPLESLRKSLQPRLTKPLFDVAITILVAENVLVAEASVARLPSHTSSIRASDRVLWERVERAMHECKFHPPPLHELADTLKQPVGGMRKICKTMVRLGALVEVRKDRYFLASALVEMGDLAHAIASESPDNSFTVAQFRDRADCGRAIAIQVLEYFDRRGITGRRGDSRIVGKTPRDVFGEMAPV
ncbi:MAG: selenocysteine-specific translation elongation factor [Rhizobiaceae bacterium]